MALHTQLPISKVTYDLSFLAAELVRNMPRDFKGLYGQRLMAECLELAMCIYRANVAKGAAKVPHLNELIERLQVTELLLRLLQDLRLIAVKHYARAIELTQAIGRQASGWRKSSHA